MQSSVLKEHTTPDMQGKKSWLKCAQNLLIHSLNLLNRAFRSLDLLNCLHDLLIHSLDLLNRVCDLHFPACMAGLSIRNLRQDGFTND